jgi:hypothetical protein
MFSVLLRLFDTFGLKSCGNFSCYKNFSAIGMIYFSDNGDTVLLVLLLEISVTNWSISSINYSNIGGIVFVSAGS